ncbi:Poly [ADP-ribose] polymerase 2-A [Acorus calamus]|uniref:Poly [ADP-ribose] polymerase n=1 Tax=Acorus calamus TaxID=4465 RepID=A0AAV9EYI7_ACOCL|nr:Poly [ADP-ribose] polymerase 2-A [Acorus calamus]
MEKVGDIERLRKMGVHELRGQASVRGLSTSGTKKVLLEGIAADIERDSAEENRNGEQLKEQVQKVDDIERIRAMGLCDLREQATLRGLLANGTKKALLARIAADIEKDLAEGIAKGVPNAPTAENCKIIQRKVVNKNGACSFDARLKETKLDPRIAKFISLVCNVNMMKQQMLEIGYNTEKLPLGKLSKSTILKGYDVLRKISEVLGQSSKKDLELLSGELQLARLRKDGIDSVHPGSKCAVLEVGVGRTKYLHWLAQDREDPLYSHYQHLCCEMAPLEVDSREFSLIQKYVQNTHAKTHSDYTVEIEQVFRVSKQGEMERFKKFSTEKNRMLLWHGSRLTNWTGILSQGLRIAPPEAPSTGYMFGKGVYFADMFSKSANYCFASNDSRAGVLLLCEVALGDISELLHADYHADRLPKGKLSTKGVGHTAPDPSEFQALEDGVVVPLGMPKQQTGTKGALLYNEYIVYNVDQIWMRYPGEFQLQHLKSYSDFS